MTINPLNNRTKFESSSNASPISHIVLYFSPPFNIMTTIRRLTTLDRLHYWTIQT